jgi:hypothetical protein
MVWGCWALGLGLLGSKVWVSGDQRLGCSGDPLNHIVNQQ